MHDPDRQLDRLYLILAATLGTLAGLCYGIIHNRLIP